MMAPLFGVYELRLGDAHLPSGELEAAFAKVGVDRGAIPVMQGEELIAGAVTYPPGEGRLVGLMQMV